MENKERLHKLVIENTADLRISLQKSFITYFFAQVKWMIYLE